jgi:hypothetical protein
MFKIMIKCKSITNEKIARILDRVTNDFSIWLHDGDTFVFFRTSSLKHLIEVNRKLLRIKGSELECVKIQKVRRLWPWA